MKPTTLALTIFILAFDAGNLCAQSGTFTAQPEEAQLLQRSHTALGINNSTPPPVFPSLQPRIQNGDTTNPADAVPKSSTLTGPTITVVSSLVVVLGLFAALVWVSRKFGSRTLGQGAIPKEVLQSLGSSPIDSRTRLTLVRCGQKILILAQTATGIQPISEITDPEEVRLLTAQCLGDSKKEFAAELQTIEKEKTAGGYVGQHAEIDSPRNRGRLFATA